MLAHGTGVRVEEGLHVGSFWCCSAWLAYHAIVFLYTYGTVQERRFGFRKMVWFSGKPLGCGNSHRFWTEASAMKECGKSVRKGKGQMQGGWTVAESYEHWSLCLSFC